MAFFSKFNWLDCFLHIFGSLSSKIIVVLAANQYLFSDESDFFNFEEWKALDTLSEDIGCMLFLQDLVKYKVIKNSAQFKKAGKHVSIFCPVDAVYKKIKAKNKNKVGETDIHVFFKGTTSISSPRVYYKLTNLSPPNFSKV